MNVLIVSRKRRSRPFDTLFDGIAKKFDHVDIKYLSVEETYNLYNHIETLSLHNYDRVLLDIPLRKLDSSLPALRSVKGLILYEEDSWQEFFRKGRFKGQYAKKFKSMANARVIVTSYKMEAYLRNKGVDAKCIPKAADDTYLWKKTEISHSRLWGESKIGSM